MFAKQLVISFWLLVISLFVFPVAAFAQTPIPSSISPTSPLYTDMLIHNMFHTFSCLAVGQSTIGQPCLTYQVTKNAQGAVQSVPVLSQVNLSGGALGATTNIIGLLYQNPPVRTADYLASVGKGLGIVKEAQAQVVGSGANVLNPILTLWQVSRNIAYVIMIIIFVIIGLMVMFRNKINPQTVITAQAALPGLVIGLILITFSYFLAGLVADTAFIGTNMVGYYFQAAQSKPILGKPPQNLVQDINDKNVMSLMGLFLNGIDRDSISQGVAAFIDNLATPASTYVRAGITIAAYQFGSTFGPAIGGMLGLIACGVAALPVVTIPGVNLVGLPAFLAVAPACATAGSAIGGPFVGAGLAFLGATNAAFVASQGLWFITLIVIIYSIFRLLMRLINCFLTIIFLVITAPFQFLIASLPGRQGMATDWILNLLANVLAFPAVLAVFYFVAYLLGQSFGPFDISKSNNRQDNFPSAVYAQGKTSITGNDTFPLFGGLNLSFINVLLAFGALVALPAIPDILARTIGKLSQTGQLIGQEISSGISGGQRYYGQAQGGLGTAQKDISGLGQFGSQREYQLLPSGQIAVMQRPGLGGRIAGKPPVLRGHINPSTGVFTPI